MSQERSSPAPGLLDPSQAAASPAPKGQNSSQLFHSSTTTPRLSAENPKPETSRANSMLASDLSRASSIDLERDPEKSEKDIEKDADSPASAAPTTTNPQSKTKDPNLVEFDGPDDPENPQNWSRTKKWILTMSLGFMTFNITLASSIFSTATFAVSEHFHIGLEVSTLGTSLFVLGFAFGPLLWGPLSELYGRTIPLYTAYALFVVFQIPVAVAVNVETIMLCRFIGGIFGCAPLAIVGGCLADFWDPVDRGVGVVSFAAAVFIGPVMGPIVGGFITQSHLGWRWTVCSILLICHGPSSRIVQDAFRKSFPEAGDCDSDFIVLPDCRLRFYRCHVVYD